MGGILIQVEDVLKAARATDEGGAVMAIRSRRSTGFYETFERKDGSKTTTYCAGCGHGIIQKLIAEAMAGPGHPGPDGLRIAGRLRRVLLLLFRLRQRGRTARPGIGRRHRASRAHCKDKVVIAYQGDGDMGAIGFNNAFQAANRGEHFAAFCVNNSIFAMTGGQMAPTTLPGQKTTTTPFGRDVAKTGYPLQMCEVFAQLEAPVFIERVSVADTKRIMQAKKAIRKALEIQRDGKGYAFVEILSPCPTNWRMDAIKSAEYVTNEMEKVFPLGNFRDRSAEPA